MSGTSELDLLFKLLGAQSECVVLGYDRHVDVLSSTLVPASPCVLVRTFRPDVNVVVMIMSHIVHGTLICLFTPFYDGKSAYPKVQKSAARRFTGRFM